MQKDKPNKFNQIYFPHSSINKFNKDNKIYQSKYPSLIMQAKTHTAFPLIESKQETYSPKIAVLSAANKLKETEQKILQAKHREIVQKRIEESIIAREEEKKKAQFFKKMVRKSFDMEKDLKHQSQTKKEKEIEKLHEFNMTVRESKFRFRETVKSIQKQQNQKIYEQTKSQRERNEELVKEFQKRELQLKQAHRQRMSQRQQKSRQRVEQFRQSRIFFIQKQRQKDVQDLEKKISSKTKYLQKFIESQNNFSHSRTRLRYKSNLSFHNDGDKSQSELNRSNVGKIVDNFKVNSMLVNPEHEVGENIFGLTESKKDKTIQQKNEGQKQEESESINFKKSQHTEEKEVPQEKIKLQGIELQEGVDQKIENKQVQEQIVEPNNVKEVQEAIKSETQKKEQLKAENKVEQPLSKDNLQQNNYQEQTAKKEQPQKEDLNNLQVNIKTSGFKQSLIQANINQ